MGRLLSCSVYTIQQRLAEPIDLYQLMPLSFVRMSVGVNQFDVEGVEVVGSGNLQATTPFT
jgi:hypothetical protein